MKRPLGCFPARNRFSASSRESPSAAIVSWIDGIRTSRSTFDAALDRFPVWSPDGSRIVFDSNRKGPAESVSGVGAQPGQRVPASGVAAGQSRRRLVRGRPLSRAIQGGAGLLHIRAGDYRIIYTVEDAALTVLVVTIRPVSHSR